MARVKVAEAEEQVTTARETEQATGAGRSMSRWPRRRARGGAIAKATRSAPRSRPRRSGCSTRPRTCSPTARPRCSAASCSSIEGIVAARSSRWRRSRTSASCRSTASGGGGSGDGSPTDEVINSALRYRVQAPLIDSLLAGHRHRGRQPLQAGRADPRGPRHAAHRHEEAGEAKPKGAKAHAAASQGPRVDRSRGKEQADATRLRLPA